MLGRNRSEPALFQMVDIESLVPRDHRLRKIHAVLDLGFVHDAVRDCYSARRGRPSIDPELAIRMLLLAKLYDLSEREVCEEISMHVGMRWFCGLNLHDPVPDHSTLSRLKNERWAESGLFDRLFDEVVRQCAEAGLISARHVSVDGTDVRANASMKSYRPVAPGAAGEEAPPEDETGGTAAAQEPSPAGAWIGHGKKYSNQTHRSTTDPEARLYRKGDRREAKLCYLVHDLIDTRSRVILRRKVSQAHSSAERKAAIEMLDELARKQDELALPRLPEIASFDAGYGTGEFAAALLERGVLPHMPLQAGAAMEEVPTWKRRTFKLDEQRRRRQKVRVAEARNRVRELQKTRGYQVSRKLRVRSEHGFAEAKTCHGMDRVRVRGCKRVSVEVSLTGAVQNLKRLAAFRGRGRRRAAAKELPGRPSRAAGRYIALHRLRPRPVSRRLIRHHRFRGWFKAWRNGFSSTAF